MASIDYEALVAACSPGGASVLTSKTALAPAAGWHGAVAPGRFLEGTNSVYAYQGRYIDGEYRQSVLLDSKQSQGNRVEAALKQAIDDGHPLLGRVPLVEVHYNTADDEKVYTDLDLPHRAWDGHVRAGTVGGAPVTAHPDYRAARNSTPANARALAEFSPGSLVFGSWDSTRKSNQARYRTVLVGEIVGVLAEQTDRAPVTPKRGGARVDPVSMQVNLASKDLLEILDAQRNELSPKLIEKVKSGASKRGDVAGSASELGLGGIPPALNDLGGVACQEIIRHHVLSFAALRQLRFGGGAEGDAAVRAVLAAYLLAGLARSDSELLLRANCDLVEAGPTVVTLDLRGGASKVLDPLKIEEADALLARALERATKLGALDWSGQRFAVVGNPAIFAAATSDE